MALPLWGELEKAQDNDQTIDEAIAAAIAAHEADPEAHLGSGESLEDHKAESVIDHPAGSVLADKQTMTEISVTTIFESLDPWSVTGEVDNTDVPGLQFYVESGFVDESGVSSQPQNPKNFRNSAFDLLFQIQAHFDFATATYNANFGFYDANSVTPGGFGFVVNGGTLRAYAKQGANVEQSDAISLTLTDDHVYRAYLDAALQQIFFHIDGTLVATLDVPGSGWEDDAGPNIWVDRGSEDDGNLFVGVLNFSRAL